MSKVLNIVLLAACLVLSSCNFLRTYRGDTEQGNLLPEGTVSKIHVGMSRPQVEDVLGLPVVSQPFNTDRLIYIYRFQPGYGKATQKTLTLYFNQRNQLSSYTVSS